MAIISFLDLIKLKTFISNAIRSLIEYLQLDFFSINFLEFIKIATDNQILEFIFIKNILSLSIKLAILN